MNINLRSELKRAEVLPGEHGTVKIQLDDAVLRGYAEKIVRSEFGIVDSSFNSAILQLSGEKYLLLCLTVLTPDERAQAERALGEFYPDQPRAGWPTWKPICSTKASFCGGCGRTSWETLCFWRDGVGDRWCKHFSGKCRTTDRCRERDWRGPSAGLELLHTRSGRWRIAEIFVVHLIVCRDGLDCGLRTNDHFIIRFLKPNT